MADETPNDQTGNSTPDSSGPDANPTTSPAPGAGPKPGTKEYLQAQVSDYLAQLAEAQAAIQSVTAERDQALADRDAYNVQAQEVAAELMQAKTDLATVQGAYDKLTAADTAQQATQAQAKVSQEQEVQELLVRNGLKAAYILPDGSVCFDATHAKHVAGADFDSLTVISAE